MIDPRSSCKERCVTAAWAARAEDLARWALERLVNRRDVWGGYVDPADRDKIVTHANGKTGPLGKTLTRPAVRQRGRALLTPHVLTNHFRARAARDVIGLHSTGPDNTSLWGGVDIDRHGPTSTAPDVNLRTALAWHDSLARRGFHPLLTDSNGAGGYHLLVLLAEPVGTPRVFHFLKALVADHAAHGMAATPETFPKQASIPLGRFGNWLRVCGRHHTRGDHWSTVYDGRGEWLAGSEAMDFILALKGDSPALMPAEARLPAAPAGPPKHWTAPGGSCGGRQGNNLSKRIAAYAARLPHGGEGSGRDDVAFGFACFLVRDLALDDALALDWLRGWNAGNCPPKSAADLEKVITNAHQYGRAAVGCGLSAEPQRRHGHHHSTIKFTLEVR